MRGKKESVEREDLHIKKDSFCIHIDSKQNCLNAFQCLNSDFYYLCDMFLNPVVNLKLFVIFYSI